MPAALDFLKVEGLGNDFVLLDRRGDTAWMDELPALQALAPSICDRRRGVGADGLLIVAPGDGEALARMVVVNHDGSRPEMCGNGLRCVALHLAATGAGRSFSVATDAGRRGCMVDALAGDGRSGSVSVDMGAATDLGVRSPGTGAGHVFRAMSMGNPHAVAFVGGEDPEGLARTLGPRVEVDVDFPGRTNVEFARVEPDGSITLWVWERGCGITQACGTGACATVAAAVLDGLVAPGAWIAVQLPGGALEVRVAATSGAAVEMRGPAREVFVGSWPLR